MKMRKPLRTKEQWLFYIKTKHCRLMGSRIWNDPYMLKRYANNLYFLYCFAHLIVQKNKIEQKNAPRL